MSSAHADSGSGDRRVSSTPPAAAASAGFTLVELLVALTLLGLLSLVLFGGFRFGARAWDAGARRIEQLNEIEVAQTLLRRQLGQARLLTSTVAPTFEGAPQAVRFVAPLPAPGGAGGFAAFALLLRETEEGGRLVLDWQVYRPDLPFLAEAEPGAEPQVEESVLLEDVAGLSLAYYGSLESEEPPEWHDRWDAGAGLPRLVRLTVEFAAGDPRRWPDFVVAPKAAAIAP